jgi:2-polyprenyl-6-methoxyphenol hydroxylase-like FAD-dependent oxidoreductase
VTVRVLIIGAGLGGLCLAHGLRKQGVEVDVYERNAAGGGALADYGIHLNEDGWAALRECLPSDIFARLDASASHAGTMLNFRDEQLRLLTRLDAAWLARRPVADVERRGIGRLALRALLLEGLAGPGAARDHVHFGKAFTRYACDGDKVTAFFADGSRATGDILVGADASRSRVREQRLPGLDRLDLGILNIAGRYPLTGDRRDRLPAWLVDGSLNNIVPRGPEWMFVSAWLLGATSPSPHPGENVDYIVWAYAARRATYPEDVDTFRPDHLQQHILSRIGGWAPALKTLVAAYDPSSVGRVPLKSMPTLVDWPPSRVTLLGDAIHNMTPMAGIGANTALRDAAELSRAVGRAGDPVEAIGSYERAMRGYANPAVALSRRNAARAASGSPLGRTAFRSILRLGECVPRLRRAVFSPT